VLHLSGVHEPSIAPLLLSSTSCYRLITFAHVKSLKESQQSATNAVWCELTNAHSHGILLMQVQKQDLNNAALLGQVQTESSQYL
jgi:hypothetical protein